MKKHSKKLTKQIKDRWEEVGVKPCEVYPMMVHGYLKEGWILVVDKRHGARKYVGACPPHALPQYWAFMCQFSQGA